MSDRITVSMSDDGVADVRLVRADKMNALDGAMFAAIVEADDALGPVEARDGSAANLLFAPLRHGCALRWSICGSAADEFLQRAPAR